MMLGRRKSREFVAANSGRTGKHPTVPRCGGNRPKDETPARAQRARFGAWYPVGKLFRRHANKRLARAIATRDCHRTVDGGWQGTILSDGGFLC